MSDPEHSPGANHPDASMIQALTRAGLLDRAQDCRFEALTGGVSSDIWKVQTPNRTFCVKRALSRLRVAAEWSAPVERNRFEVAWYRLANQHCPGAAPEVLAHDEGAMLCAMEYLDPASHRLWKSELRNGRVDPSVASSCGQRLVRIHAATADDEGVAARFPRSDIFRAIRLEPYLEATADSHPDLRPELFGLSERTAATRRVMIHGDVSPKNILVGPRGPVFLDAECACVGDPAFDLAFCLNHLLLKCLGAPGSRAALLASFEALVDAYMAGVNWELPAALESRGASLLPGLLLARVDGKSPAEYVTAPEDKARVRRCARRLLFEPPETLTQVARAWRQELSE
jgi:aminoglycoside phosphotransferase (APT) family kinase protein